MMCQCGGRVETEKLVDEIPKYKELIQLFVITKPINWDKLCQQYQLLLPAEDTSSPVTDFFTIGQFSKSHL
ncbi:hypothetical protein GHT06_019782 [Daphnia sinensis]|uniref:Uncharacterized protein n=1 Tax=Daphnia sinensis TaxID=1820382 RepID=A0AAD5KKK0_9CRUS|nr:hypothetical protein GHT06_019782 [Daphnia sinensis]